MNGDIPKKTGLAVCTKHVRLEVVAFCSCSTKLGGIVEREQERQGERERERERAGEAGREREREGEIEWHRC